MNLAIDIDTNFMLIKLHKLLNIFYLLVFIRLSNIFFMFNNVRKIKKRIGFV